MPLIYFLFYLIFFEVVVLLHLDIIIFSCAVNFPGQNSNPFGQNGERKLHYRWHTAPFNTENRHLFHLICFGNIWNTSSCMHTNNLQSVKVSWGLCRAPPSQKSPFVSSPSQECWADGNLSAWGHIPVNSSPAHLQGTWGQLPSPCITGHRIDTSSASKSSKDPRVYQNSQQHGEKPFRLSAELLGDWTADTSINISKYQWMKSNAIHVLILWYGF